jgi:hypothetical protein
VEGQWISSTTSESSGNTSFGGTLSEIAAASNQAGTQGTMAMAEAIPNPADKGKKEKCFRCNLSAGDVGTDCNVELCLYCDSALHKHDICPLISKPKHTAVMYGLCRDDLMWFEIQKSNDVRIKNTRGKVCWIIVTGGSMTTQENIAELDVLVPGNKQWELEAVANGVYKVILPTKSDMARVRKVKDLEVDSERKMFFEEWSSKRVKKCGLYDIWVRIN